MGVLKKEGRQKTEDGKWRWKTLFLRSTIFLFGLFLLPTCEADPSTKIKLSYSERRAVDTLYKERLLLLSPILDSICDTNFEKEVQATIDSILQMRRADEMRLRKKIPIKGQNIE